MADENSLFDQVKTLVTHHGEAGRHMVAHDDVMLGGLVMLLSHDESRVRNALEILHMLSQDKGNQARMHNFIGLMGSLENVRKGNIADLAVLAADVERYLNPSHHDVLRERLVNKSKQTPPKSARKKVPRNVFIVQSKAVILRVNGMHHQSDADVCRDALVPIKGVVSVTFVIPKQRCIARIKPDVKPETLVWAINRTDSSLSAQQVVKDDTGREVLLSFGTTPPALEKENEDMPPYLEDSPVKDDKHTIARVGENDPEQNSGWLGKVGNFISNSLYWNY